MGAKECVRALIHPVPSDVGSLLIVRISYDQRNKNVGESVFDLFRPERMTNRLAPIKMYLNKLRRTIRPQVNCHHHQNPKAGNALTISPFLVDDDNHSICTGDLENIDGLPLHVSTILILPLECKMLTLGSMLPLDFIDQPMTANELN